MAGRGLPGTRSMVFFHNNDVTMYAPHGMILEWGNPFRCVCKNGVVVNATWTFFSRSRFRRWGAYLVSYLRSDWTVGILRKLSILLIMLKSSKGGVLRLNWGPRQWRDFEGSPPDGKSSLTTSWGLKSSNRYVHWISLKIPSNLVYRNVKIDAGIRVQRHFFDWYLICDIIC